MSSKINVFVVALLVQALFCGTASAQSAAADEASPDVWRSTLFAYLWATSMDGTAAIRGREVDVDASFSDLVKELDAALSLRFESHKGRWGYFLDGMYVELKPSERTPIGKVEVTSKTFIFEAGGVHHFSSSVQGLFGVRYQDMSLDIDVPQASVGGDKDWVDGFVGLRWMPLRGDSWRMWLRGDVGTGDSDFVWNAMVGAEYSFSERWSVVAAYRVLSTDVKKGGFKWDVDMSGLGLAVGYTF